MLEALLQALISGLAVGGAYALVALGFSITFTTTKTLNFSHGEFVSAGAFIGMSALFLVLGKPFDSTTFGDAVPGAGAQLFALVLAPGVMGALGWLLYVLGVRPFAGRPGMAWVMSTLGFGVILQSIGLGDLGSEAGRRAGAGRRCGAALRQHRRASSGAADARCRRRRDARVRPRDEPNDDRQGDARGGCERQRREPDGHQHQRRDDRRVRDQFGTRRACRGSCSRRSPRPRSSWA